LHQVSWEIGQTDEHHVDWRYLFCGFSLLRSPDKAYPILPYGRAIAYLSVGWVERVKLLLIVAKSVGFR
jgi:hypothetical protein